MKKLIILLAAGASRRLGHPKQLVRFEGKSLVRRAAEAALAARAEAVAVVVGAAREAVKKELAGLPVVILENENWAEGMAASVRGGAAWAAKVVGGDANNGPRGVANNGPRRDANNGPRRDGNNGDWAVLFSVIDQPKLETAVFERLFSALETGEKSLAASLLDGQTIGPPVAFRARFLPELLRLEGDAGAKKVVLQHLEEAALVPFAGGAWDVDEATDLPED